ncbi:MAG: glycosylhydrolase-like jelly roll fold domain-containing protein, partial [Planctomycetota bacterium]
SSQHPGIKYFSGTATYSVQFEMPVSADGDYWLDLGKVCEVGEVSIDAHDLGIAWTYPFRVKVPAKLLTEGTHILEVKATNVWNNRLVGDQLLPKEQRITRTNLQGTHKKDSPLVPSGLLGPVTLVPVK